MIDHERSSVELLSPRLTGLRNGDSPMTTRWIDPAMFLAPSESRRRAKYALKVQLIASEPTMKVWDCTRDTLLVGRIVQPLYGFKAVELGCQTYEYQVIDFTQSVKGAPLGTFLTLKAAAAAIRKL